MSVEATFYMTTMTRPDQTMTTRPRFCPGILWRSLGSLRAIWLLGEPPMQPSPFQDQLLLCIANKRIEFDSSNNDFWYSVIFWRDRIILRLDNKFYNVCPRTICRRDEICPGTEYVLGRKMLTFWDVKKKKKIYLWSGQQYIVNNYHYLEVCPSTRYSRHSNAEYIHRLHAVM